MIAFFILAALSLLVVYVADPRRSMRNRSRSRPLRLTAILFR